MGNKTSTLAFRLGIFQSHHADWIVKDSEVARVLKEDFEIRQYLEKKFKISAGISKINISRTKDGIELSVKCLKAAHLVGKKGAEINLITADLKKMTGLDIKIKIFDIKRPEISASCIAREVAFELKKRGVSCRRIMKKVVQNARKNGALGVRVECSGRLAGAEIARTESYFEGSVPRHTLKANIDYASEPAFAAWGVCGVKIWVYRGEFTKKDSPLKSSAAKDFSKNGGNI